MHLSLKVLLKGKFKYNDSNYKKVLKYAKSKRFIPNWVYSGIDKFVSIANSSYGIGYAMKHYKEYFNYRVSYSVTIGVGFCKIKISSNFNRFSISFLFM